MEQSARLTGSQYSGNEANALIHFYRAEVGKMTAYRQRLDMTTNWSVVTTAGLVSFAFGDNNNSHVVFLFAMLMNYFFLHLEARRFRIFEISFHRTRIMERYFYPAMLGEEVDAGWHRLLLSELAHPQSPIGRWNSLGWRLRRNYLWIYAGVLLAWIAKLDTVRAKSEAFSPKTLLEEAHIGSFPGWAVWLTVLAFYGYLIALVVQATREHPLEEG